MQKVLIIGATSAIAEATARIFAKRGDQVYLLARNAERLAMIAKDLQIRGAKQVNVSAFDANQLDDLESELKKAEVTLNGIDIVLIAYGTLPNQRACEKDPAKMLQELQINILSTLTFLTLLANFMEEKRHGTLAVITSVAGDRGRQSNYVYGAAKAAVSVFLQGLRNRLHPSGVRVLTIKPGFVDTPMTAHFKKGFLWASPEKIAKEIVRAIEKNKNEVYLPSFWRWIMFVIRHIPENIFKKMKL